MGANVPGNYPPGYHQGVGGTTGYHEVINILGKRNKAGTLTGIDPPPGVSETEDDNEEEGAPKKPPRPLYRRFINYVRQAWTGVKFALGKKFMKKIACFIIYCS